MADIDLQLLGAATISSRQRVMSVTPRSTAELLACIVLAGSHGILRDRVAARLWPDLPPKNGLMQLRIALTKLRPQLAKQNLSETLELEGKVLRFTGSARVDIWEVPHARPTAEGLKGALQPFAIGWNPDHWESERDALAEATANLLEAFVMGESAADEKIENLKIAASLYPTSKRVAAILVGFLYAADRDAEANHWTVKFEDAWVDRFGSVDIPAITGGRTPAPVAPRKFSRPQARFGRRKALVVGFGLCMTVSGLALFFSQKASDQQTASISLVSSYPIRISGSEYIVRELNLRGVDSVSILNLVAMGDGSFVFQTRNRGKLQQYIVHPNDSCYQLTSSDKRMVDSLAGRSIWADEDNRHVIVESPDGPAAFTGDEEYPFFVPVAFVTPSSFLFYGLCGHHQADHYRFCMMLDGHPVKLNLNSGQYQTAQINVLTPNGFFGRYSKGLGDKWDYHSFYYDLTSNTTQEMETEPVVGVLSTGYVTLPCKIGPEEDNFPEVPPEEVLLQDKDGNNLASRSLGNDPADARVVVIGELVALVTKRNSLTRNCQLLDSRFRDVPAPDFLNKPIFDVIGTEFGTAKAMLVEEARSGTGSARFYLVTKAAVSAPSAKPGAG